MTISLNQTSPLVSVVIPYYNGERYIEETLRSIANQTYQNIELIVVDDASNQKGANKIQALQKQYDFQLITKEQNEGPSQAIATAVLQSQGEYIAYLGHDDLFEPSKIQKQVQFFQENSNLIAVYSGMKYWSMETGEISFPDFSNTVNNIKEKSTLPLLYFSVPISISLQTLLTKREVVLKNMLPIWKRLRLDDWPCHMELFESYPTKIGFLEEYLTIYRVHTESLSHDLPKLLSLTLETAVYKVPKEFQSQAIESILLLTINYRIFFRLFLKAFLIRMKAKGKASPFFRRFFYFCSVITKLLRITS